MEAQEELDYHDEQCTKGRLYPISILNVEARFVFIFPDELLVEPIVSREAWELLEEDLFVIIFIAASLFFVAVLILDHLFDGALVVYSFLFELHELRKVLNKALIPQVECSFARASWEVILVFELPRHDLLHDADYFVAHVVAEVVLVEDGAVFVEELEALLIEPPMLTNDLVKSLHIRDFGYLECFHAELVLL